MRTHLNALLSLAAGAIIGLSAVPAAQAADLAVTRAKRAHVHHWGRIVRDYDGTPVVLGRYHPTHPVLVSDYIGAPIAVDRFYRTYPVQQQPIPYLYRHLHQPLYYSRVRSSYIHWGY